MSLTVRLFILAALCAFLQVGIVAARPNYNSLARRSVPTAAPGLTNAERLARGLPLKKPQLKRRGDKQNKPSVVPNADFAAPTPVAAAADNCSPQSGIVKITSEDGSVDGFLAAPAEDGLYGFTSEEVSAVTVKVDTCNGAPYNIIGKSVELNGETFENLGGAEDPHTGCVFVGNVPKVSEPQARSNPLASKQGVASSKCGSAIWNLDGDNLSARWSQDDDTTYSSLVFVKDRSAFALASDNCTGVKASFAFVPV